MSGSSFANLASLTKQNLLYRKFCPKNLFVANGGILNPNGIFMQAQCIWFGFGVNEDKQRAFELFKKAAELGSAQGALDAGKALYLGEGTQKNVEQALVYFEKSAAGGIAEAKDAIEICRKEIEQ